MVFDAFKDFFKGVGGMGEVDDDFKILTFVYPIHTALDLIKSVDALFDLLIR